MQLADATAVRLVKGPDETITIRIGEAAATLTLEQWSALIAHPERLSLERGKLEPVRGR